MEDGYLPECLGIFAVIIAVAAILYGFEKALFALNEGVLERKAEEEENAKAKKLLRLIEKENRFFYGVRTAHVILGIVLGANVLIRTYQLAHDMLKIEGSLNTSLLMTGVGLLVLFIYLVFGVIVPRKLAGNHPEAWANRLLPIVSLIMSLLRPVTILAEMTGGGIVRLLGMDPNVKTGTVTEEELMSMVNEGHETGVLEANEAEMITNIFEFGDKEACDVMTHRTNLVAVDGQLTLKQAVEYMLQESYSRFPVYNEDIDDIAGILHIKDAFVLREKEKFADVPVLEIPGLLREAHFIPETRNIDTLFHDMQLKKIHMAIVIDEYGQTAGLITMEDILEEIVGNILDEYDEEENMVEASADGSYVFDGLTPLEDVGELLNLDFTEEEYETLNGFLISRLERIPKEDECPAILYEGYRFQILAVENKMIHSVKVEREETTENEENAC